MITDGHISAAGGLIQGADNWGVMGITVFFVFVFTVLIGFFLYFIVGKLGTVIDRNTDTIEQSLQNSRDMLHGIKSGDDKLGKIYDIGLKNNDILKDVYNEAKRNGLKCDYKHGINNFDIKGFANDERRDLRSEYGQEN